MNSLIFGIIRSFGNSAVWGFTALGVFTAVWGMKALRFRSMTLRTPSLSVVLSICLSGACWGASEKLSPELRGANASPDLDVIIQYKQVPTNADHQTVAEKGGVMKRQFRYVRGGVYHVPSSALDDIAKAPERGVHLPRPCPEGPSRSGRRHHRRKPGGFLRREWRGHRRGGDRQRYCEGPRSARQSGIRAEF